MEARFIRPDTRADGYGFNATQECAFTAAPYGPPNEAARTPTTTPPYFDALEMRHHVACATWDIE